MKKIIWCLGSALTCVAFFGCVSHSLGAYSKPVEYQEFSGWEINNESDFLRQIRNANIKGFKITDARISYETKDSVAAVKINDLYVKFDNFKAVQPDFAERLEPSKKYTVYLGYISEGNFWTGYKYVPVLEDIENLRTVQEIKEEAERLEKERLAKEKADLEAKAKKAKELKIKAESLTQGYIYHGPDEANENAVLFNNGALEYGHAYYIEAFMVKGGGSLGGAIVSLFFNPEYQYISYINQKVRGEVTSAGETIFGTLPVTVIVAGGKAPVYIPVVLGLLE